MRLPSDYIKNTAAKNQALIKISLDRGYTKYLPELQNINGYLSWLLKNSSKPFNFISQISEGLTLFVGEGNFSFSLFLAKNPITNPSNIVSTTLEKWSDLSKLALDNSEKLAVLGAKVLHHVDATKLSEIFGSQKFDSIIFQFPNVGSRETIEGRNPNYILIRDFLKSAAQHLYTNGKVIISAVDNSYYKGAFNFEEAAEDSNFRIIKVYPFDPSNFPNYIHTMTLEDESGIENHTDFATWVFVLE